MDIDWAILGRIAVVATAAALTVCVLVALALVAWSARTSRPADGSGTSAVQVRARTGIAVVCVLAAGLIVGYGLYLIVA